MTRRLGDWLLKSAGNGVFEVIHVDSGEARAVARVGVELGPALSVRRVKGKPRAIEPAAGEAGDRVVLSDCRKGDPDCFRLTAALSGADLEIILAGDSRHEAGRRHFHLFWWHAEFGTSDGEVVIHGPTLASDPWS